MKDLNAGPEMQIEESNIPLEDRAEDINTCISTSRVVVVNETSSARMKQLHESDNSDYNKNLATQWLVPQLVPMEASPQG